MTRRAVPFGIGWYFGLTAAFFLCVNGPLGIGGGAVLTAAALLIGILAAVFRVSYKNRALLFLAAFAVASAYSSLFAALRLAPLEALDGKTVTVSGTVEEYSESDRSLVTLRGKVDGIPTKVSAYINGFSGGFSDRVTFDAIISVHRDTAFFRSRETYLPDGVYVGATAVGRAEISDKRSVFGLVREYSRNVSRKILTNVGGKAGELLCACVTGDWSALSDSLRLSLNRAGAGHLASVSGLHVSVAALTVLYILKRLKAPKFVYILSTEAIIILFVVFSGMRVSAIRAAVMMSIALMSYAVRRRTDPLNTLCVCAFLMTVLNPFAAADSSLMLSLSGVFGVAVMSPSLIKEFGIKNRLLKAVCVSVCASLSTAPFAMLYFNELSVISPFVNLLAIPLCTVSLVLGMLFALTGCVFTPLIQAAGIFAKLTVSLCDWASKFGFSYISLGFGAVSAVAGCAAVISAAVFLISKSPRITSFSAAAGAAITLAVYACISIMTSGNLYLTVLSQGDSHAAVLRKGGDCIIIDFDGGCAGAVETVLERRGAAGIPAVFIFENAAASYAEYSDLPFKAEKFYIPEGEYIYGAGDVEYISDGFSASASGITFYCRDGGIKIDISESSGVSLLRGLTVITQNDEKTVYKGDIIKEIRLGGD